MVSQEYVLFLTPDEGVFRYDPKTGELTRSVAQDAAVNSSAINSSSYKQVLKVVAIFKK
ncbi:MAG: hypothetical protein K2J71_05080 [Oscillospiraceae bacterium]|nr:hypothetical protein [Oscillospiraceae bacterium]